jgi:hypothetical protein
MRIRRRIEFGGGERSRRGTTTSSRRAIGNHDARRRSAGHIHGSRPSGDSRRRPYSIVDVASFVVAAGGIRIGSISDILVRSIGEVIGIHESGGRRRGRGWRRKSGIRGIGRSGNSDDDEIVIMTRTDDDDDEDVRFVTHHPLWRTLGGDRSFPYPCFAVSSRIEA